MARTAWAGAALLLTLTLGCHSSGDDTPTTYPAAGRVVLADGKPLAGATVQFVAAGATVAVSGVTDADGHFALSTVKGKKKVSGAVVGEYKVTIYPPIPDDHRAVRPITLPKTYKVEERDNNYSFTVPRPTVSGKSVR